MICRELVPIGASSVLVLAFGIPSLLAEHNVDLCHQARACHFTCGQQGGRSIPYEEDIDLPLCFSQAKWHARAWFHLPLLVPTHRLTYRRAPLSAAVDPLAKLDLSNNGADQSFFRYHECTIRCCTCIPIICDGGLRKSASPCAHQQSQ